VPLLPPLVLNPGQHKYFQNIYLIFILCSRTPIVLDGLATTNFNSFVATITLHIPDVTVITLQGERRTDKKSAQDSASLIMLQKLEELKVCICKT
jgi:hypothetical protein